MNLGKAASGLETDSLSDIGQRLKDTAVSSALTFGVLNVAGLSGRLAHTYESLNKLSATQVNALYKSTVDQYAETLKSDGFNDIQIESYLDEAMKTTGVENQKSAIVKLQGEMGNGNVLSDEGGDAKKLANKNDLVTYRRVQGGEGNKSSQQRIIVTKDGSIAITNKESNLNVSIDDGEHSTYFRNNKRGGDAEIVEFEVPKWFDVFLQENAVPQRDYKINPNNQGGITPKIVDETKPGKAFELPYPWTEWLEEYAQDARYKK